MAKTSRPLFGWPGKKGRASEEIINHFPPHRTYVEPRVGGGSVFFAKTPSEREIVSDPNPNVTRLFEGAKKGIRCRAVVQSQHDLMQMVSRDSMEVCDIYARTKCSRDHKGTQPRGKESYPCSIRWPWKSQAYRLRNVRLERGNYDDIMRRFDGSETLHYLDLPPYRTGNQYRDQVANAPLGAIKKTALQMRGSVVISSNDHPAVWNTFCRKPSAFACYVIKKPGRDAKHLTGNSTKNLLVMVKP